MRKKEKHLFQLLPYKFKLHLEHQQDNSDKEIMFVKVDVIMAGKNYQRTLLMDDCDIFSLWQKID